MGVNGWFLHFYIWFLPNVKILKIWWWHIRCMGFSKFILHWVLFFSLFFFAVWCQRVSYWCGAVQWCQCSRGGTAGWPQHQNPDRSETVWNLGILLLKATICTQYDNNEFKKHFCGLKEFVFSSVCVSGALSENIKIIISVFHFRAVKNLPWLAEATYTGEALQYSLRNMLSKLVKERSVVIVLTDGRSDTIKDTVSLNVLCGKGFKVKI